LGKVHQQVTCSAFLQGYLDLGIDVGEHKPATSHIHNRTKFGQGAHANEDRHFLRHEGVDAQEDLLGANMLRK
jgi:hypothetical protein